jgi:hypothetical protein
MARNIIFITKKRNVIIKSASERKKQKAKKRGKIIERRHTVTGDQRNRV